MPWFAIRALYLHESDPSRSRVYEERLLLFDAESAELAFEMAENESGDYLKLNSSFRRVGSFSCFALNPKASNLHGAEVWSVLLESGLDPAALYQQRYTDVEYVLRES